MSRLAELARPRPQAPEPVEERCELCGEALPGEHRHVADVASRSLLCCCRGCAVLLGREGAGGGHYQLVPERRVLLAESPLDVEELDLPIGLAFLFFSSAVGRVVALYPSPAGATESLLPIDATLDGFEPDVEALLVRRTGGPPEHYLVPIDDCYALVALIRTHWQGLNGGEDVRRGLARFFDELRGNATTHEEVR